MPFISIIFPTSRSSKIFDETLSSISRAADSPGVEVIVVENGKKDSAFEEKVSSYGFQYYYEPIEGLLSGRHLGASKSNGDILAFVDDDIVLSKHWIKGLRNAFAKPEIHLATGPSYPRFLSPVPDWINNFWVEVNKTGRALYKLSLLQLEPAFQKIPPNLVLGLNFGIRREKLFELGGFHPDGVSWKMRRFRGDGENGLTMKAFKLGLEAVYHPMMALEHIIPSSRISVSYFEKRTYLQGISDSFTDFRKFKKFRDKEKVKTADQKQRISIENRISKSYSLGFQYHQDEMKKDPTLVEWVLRENFWGYEYPSLNV